MALKDNNSNSSQKAAASTANADIVSTTVKTVKKIPKKESADTSKASTNEIVKAIKEAGNISRKKNQKSKKQEPVVVAGRPRKIIRRKPGIKNPANYFTSDTQDSIVEYQQTDDRKSKEQIYVKRIMPAFDSLVENLINVYGFKISHESKSDLKTECLEFLYSTVEKFDASKGSKAFSYFNVVAKNWLTIKSKQNVKRTKTYVSSDDKDSMSSSDLEQYEHHNVVPSYEEMLQKAEMSKYLKSLVVELEKKAKTDNEKATIMAINTIIENIDNIDILSKRAVLLYIREITGMSSKQLSLVLASIKKYYKEIKRS